MKDKDLKRKKIVAALSAVSAYIKSGEEMAAMQAPAAPAPAPEKPARLPSLWGVSGRQDMMQMRNMMQMKAFQVKAR